MSLNQGPTDHLITCVETAKQTLFSLKGSLSAQEMYHNEVINQFLTAFNLSDIQQIDKRYPHQRAELALPAEQANHYCLIVKGSFAILAHGIESILKVFNTNPTSAKLITLNRSTLLLAKTKLLNENNLVTFLRQNRAIEKDSPQECTKDMLEQTVNQLMDDLKSLSEAERLAMEYYEVILKTEELFKQLALLEKALGSLHQKLSALTPIVVEAPRVPATGSWDRLAGEKELDGNALAAILSARLSLKTPDPAEWDIHSAANSRPASLTAPLSPRSLKAALTEQSQAVPASLTDLSQEGAPRPNS